MNIDSVQIPHSNDIKEYCIAGSEYLPSIIPNNTDEYAEASKEGRNLLISGHVMSVRFNAITSRLKYCFVKRVVIPQTRINENTYSVLVYIHECGSGECNCVAGLISSCKHVFAILHYIEKEVNLGHSKTCKS